MTYPEHWTLCLGKPNPCCSIVCSCRPETQGALGLGAEGCGGIVDVYRPHLQGEGYYYDVNSLYPTAMTRANPDNPDCFAGWNMIVPYGSTVSLISAFLFLYILYAHFTSQA